MRRREFITLLGGSAVAWPLAARARQPTATTHRLGLLFTASEKAYKARGLLEAVTQGLKEYGWVEGQNITIEYRFADGNGLTQTAVAKQSGMNRSYLSHLESGRRNPTLATLERLAKILNVAPGYFL